MEFWFSFLMDAFLRFLPIIFHKSSTKKYVRSIYLEKKIQVLSSILLFNEFQKKTKIEKNVSSKVFFGLKV